MVIVGIVGVLTAWHLAGRGFGVVPCQKGRIAGEQSGCNRGRVRPQGRPLAELPIKAESLSTWRSLARDPGGGLGFVQVGVAHIARGAAETERFGTRLDAALGHGLDSRLLGRDATARLIPRLSAKATVATMRPMREVFAGNAAGDRLAFRRRLDGGHSIAAGALHDFFIGPDAFHHLTRSCALPRRDARNARLHPAAPHGYPDGRRTPRRGSADGVSPFGRIRVLNSAPNPAILRRIREGFAAALLAPASARAWGGVANLAAGRPPGHDLAGFRLERFSDGPKIAPGPSL